MNVLFSRHQEKLIRIHHWHEFADYSEPLKWERVCMIKWFSNGINELGRLLNDNRQCQVNCQFRFLFHNSYKVMNMLFFPIKSFYSFHKSSHFQLINGIGQFIFCYRWSIISRSSKYVFGLCFKSKRTFIMS